MRKGSVTALRAGLLATALLAGPFLLDTPAPASHDETPEVLAEGEGRDETFYLCTACHNTALIRRSGFTRQQWDDLMTWMTERHGMNPLEGELRETIVNYLAQAYPPRRQRPPAFANPFATN